MRLLKKHGMLLLEKGLITDQLHYLAESEDGCLLEFFEWKNESAKTIGYRLPEVRAFWEKMTKYATFPPLSELKETHSSFAGFKAS